MKKKWMKTVAGGTMADVTNVRGTVCIVTGGASGIGAALCRQLSRHGARTVVVADRDQEGCSRVVQSIDGGVAWPCDVSVESQVKSMIHEVEQRFGPIYLYCSNAGVISKTQSLVDVGVQVSCFLCWG